VPNRPKYVVDDGRGGTRLSSAALDLRPDEEGCSVDVRRLLPDPADPSSVLDGYPQEWGLACLEAGAARRLQHNVVGDPLTGDAENPAHALVIPLAASRAARKRNFSELAKTASWIGQPPVLDEPVIQP
jgi:hypothetical protein